MLVSTLSIYYISETKVVFMILHIKMYSSKKKNSKVQLN